MHPSFSKTLPAFTVMGLSVRTNNTAEQNPLTGKIGPLIQRYYRENIADQLPQRTSAGLSYSLYTAYESDFQGPYTYAFGEEVAPGSAPPLGIQKIILPAQTYAVFTVGPGPIPTLITEAWQEIWKMTAKDLGGERSYLGDFERYDDRARNPQEAIVDIYIGIT